MHCRRASSVVTGVERATNGTLPDARRQFRFAHALCQLRAHRSARAVAQFEIQPDRTSFDQLLDVVSTNPDAPRVTQPDTRQVAAVDQVTQRRIRRAVFGRRLLQRD